MDYRSAGVSIEAGNEVVRRIRSLAASTYTRGVLSELGSFGGLFALEPGRFAQPVLVSSADGVGTKLKVAFLAGRHDTVGEDLVNHCVNDILAQGARPLFFLDYVATGRLLPEVAVAVVEGLARGCRANGCALIGGETAEMPGFYADGEYDVAGFIVGIVEREQLIDGRTIGPGDVLIGLASSGLHTNGYSLARRIVFDHLKLSVDSVVPALGASVGDVLLRPHRTYLGVVGPLLETGWIKGMAHITGGGITDNLPRVLPEGMQALVDRGTWQRPALFEWLVRQGEVPEEDAYRTFNMGIGLILVCAATRANQVLAALERAGESTAVRLGQIVPGPRCVHYR